MHGWLDDCLLSSKHLLPQDRGVATFKTPGLSREAADAATALQTTRVRRWLGLLLESFKWL